MCMMEISDIIAVNKKFIRITSPIISIYFSELLEILKQVKRKNRYDLETGYWKLDRKYVREEVGIEPEEQRNCDQALVKLGILGIDANSVDKIRINVKRYFELLAEETIDETSKLSKTAKMTAAEKKVAKRNAIIEGIVNLFNETDETAKIAVTKLVEVYFDKGYCKHSQWTPIIQMMHACTTDPKGISELVDHILATNWQSIPAAIDSFMKKYKPAGTKINAEQKKCYNTLFGVEF